MPLKPVAGAAARYMDVVEVQRRELNSWTARRGDSVSYKLDDAVTRLKLGKVPQHHRVPIEWQAVKRTD